MSSPAWNDPAFTIAAALLVGMIAHTLARHLRVPGIVLLLGAGERRGEILFRLDGEPVPAT